MPENGQQKFSITCRSPEQTECLARRLAEACGANDTLLLSGPIGSGKTVFARAFIQSLLATAGIHDEVPSPTYTLVQTYLAGDIEIWHADLYRLQSSFEAVELGLDEAFDQALCLIEWPERLGAMQPGNGHRIQFAFDQSEEHVRRIQVCTGQPGFARVLSSPVGGC